MLRLELPLQLVIPFPVIDLLLQLLCDHLIKCSTICVIVLTWARLIHHTEACAVVTDLHNIRKDMLNY